MTDNIGAELAKAEENYLNIEEKLSDPAVIADMGTWQRYSKEQSDLAETVEKVLGTKGKTRIGETGFHVYVTLDTQLSAEDVKVHTAINNWLVANINTT